MAETSPRNPIPMNYRIQHYVPQWYQRRFVEPGTRQGVLHYLGLNRRYVVGSDGRRREVSAHRLEPTRKCFAEEDLYTLKFGSFASTVLEQEFFGGVDNQGSRSVSYWDRFAHPSVNEDALRGLLLYMSTQKLRTPKGLDWLSQQIETTEPNALLRTLAKLRNLYSTIWCECVWQIADATKSDTKFIVSDHPVTVYNRRCGPQSEWCRGSNEPDIRLQASHTIFPLGLEKVLILTNLSWVRDPYQSPTSMRPNPALFRDSIFNFFDVQTQRSLSEDEVRQINFILKRRAYRYIAAAREEWLYPEKWVSKADWSTYGAGYLLMPDPRGVHHGGEYVLGYHDGSTDAYDAYGRKPCEVGYGIDPSQRGARTPLQRFQGEFARLNGPLRRGRSFQGARLDPERYDDEMHAYHLALERRRS